MHSKRPNEWQLMAWRTNNYKPPQVIFKVIPQYCYAHPYCA